MPKNKRLNNIKKADINHFTVGTCSRMCPEDEIWMRERNCLLHFFEIQKSGETGKHSKADKDKMVKAYSRSAAGKDSYKPSDIRPFKVLVQTIRYLFKEIFPLHKTYSPIMVYDFMFDRLRAVRQDMIVQDLSPKETIFLFQPIIKFHIFFGYVLCEEPIETYDSKINNSHLLECIKRVLVCYHLGNNEHEPFYEDRTTLEHFIFVQSVYLIVTLGNTESLQEAYSLNISSMNEGLDMFLNLSVGWYLKNYSYVFKHFKFLPILCKCVFIQHLPAIRRHVLMSMSIAYSTQNCAIPVDELYTHLLYNESKDLEFDCEHYNISILNGSIKFQKGMFDFNVELTKVKKLRLIDKELEKQDMNILFPS